MDKYPMQVHHKAKGAVYSLKPIYSHYFCLLQMTSFPYTFGFRFLDINNFRVLN
jgi:hypothetical protein